MRIRMRCTRRGPFGVLRIGTETDVPDELGAALIAEEAAELIAPAPPIPEANNPDATKPEPSQPGNEPAPPTKRRRGQSR